MSCSLLTWTQLNLAVLAIFFAAVERGVYFRSDGEGDGDDHGRFFAPCSAPNVLHDYLDEEWANEPRCRFLPENRMVVLGWNKLCDTVDHLSDEEISMFLLAGGGVLIGLAWLISVCCSQPEEEDLEDESEEEPQGAGSAGAAGEAEDNTGVEDLPVALESEFVERFIYYEICLDKDFIQNQFGGNTPPEAAALAAGGPGSPPGSPGGPGSPPGSPGGRKREKWGLAVERGDRKTWVVVKITTGTPSFYAEGAPVKGMASEMNPAGRIKLEKGDLIIAVNGRTSISDFSKEIKNPNIRQIRLCMVRTQFKAEVRQPGSDLSQKMKSQIVKEASARFSFEKSPNVTLHSFLPSRDEGEVFRELTIEGWTPEADGQPGSEDPGSPRGGLGITTRLCVRTGDQKGNFGLVPGDGSSETVPVTKEQQGPKTYLLYVEGVAEDSILGRFAGLREGDFIENINANRGRDALVLSLKKLAKFPKKNGVKIGVWRVEGPERK